MDACLQTMGISTGGDAHSWSDGHGERSRQAIVGAAIARAAIARATTARTWRPTVRATTAKVSLVRVGRTARPVRRRGTPARTARAASSGANSRFGGAVASQAVKSFTPPHRGPNQRRPRGRAPNPATPPLPTPSWEKAATGRTRTPPRLPCPPRLGKRRRLAAQAAASLPPGKGGEPRHASLARLGKGGDSSTPPRLPCLTPSWKKAATGHLGPRRASLAHPRPGKRRRLATPNCPPPCHPVPGKRRRLAALRTPPRSLAHPRLEKAATGHHSQPRHASLAPPRPGKRRLAAPPPCPHASPHSTPVASTAAYLASAAAPSPSAGRGRPFTVPPSPT